MTYLKSKIFIKSLVLYCTIGLFIIGYVFFGRYIPNDFRQAVGIILSCICVILFLWTLFYLFLESYSRLKLKNTIENLEEEKERQLKYFGNFEKEHLLRHYISLQDKFSNNTHFIHLLKSKEELTNRSNIGNYFCVLLIFFAGQFIFDSISQIGSIIFISLASACIVFCIRILSWEIFRRKNFLSPIFIGHVLIIYLLFTWGKNSYIKSFGNENLGSYFEKPEYTSRYYVNIAPVDDRNIFEDSKKYFHLPAEIHVFSEIVEGKKSEGYFTPEYTSFSTSKYIIINKVFSSNGGVLTFSDCQAEIGEKIFCHDQNGKMWKIELTKEKVK